jgi:hypothetical protein
MHFPPSQPTGPPLARTYGNTLSCVQVELSCCGIWPYESETLKRRKSKVVHKKLQTELPHDPAVTLPGPHLKGVKSECHRDTCTPVFTVAPLTGAKVWD